MQNETPQHLHLTGITVAISQQAAATALELAQRAKQAGWRFSFDLNFRSKLWSTEAANKGCEPFMQLADLLITPIRDAQSIYNLDASLTPEAAIQQLSARYPNKTIAMTLGADGSIGLDENGRIHHQSIFETTNVDRLGSGDAFTAGLLYGYYFADQNQDLAQGLRWGTAMAAMKRTIKGDLPLIDKTAVAQLVEAKQGNADVR